MYYIDMLSSFVTYTFALYMYSCMWTRKKKKTAQLHTAPDDDFNCELEDNVAYVTAHNKLFSEACFEVEEEEEKEEEKDGCEESSMSVDDKITDLDPVSPKLPCRQYLQEKEVQRGSPIFWKLLI